MRGEPFDEQELLRKHEEDQFKKLFDPECIPRHPNGVEEGVTERGGCTFVDMMNDTCRVEDSSLQVEDDLGLSDEVLDTSTSALGEVEFDP